MVDLRPFSVWRAVRWQAAMLLLLTLSLLTAALLFEREVARSISEAIDRTTLARMQASAARQVLSTVQDAETGQRGFLLTGRAYYLEPYQQATAQVATALKHLDELSLANSMAARRSRTVTRISAPKNGGNGTDRGVGSRRAAAGCCGSGADR